MYLQCGAAIFQVCPESPIFRLPAFMKNDVKNWMKTEFPQNLALLKSQAGDPIEIERIQNDLLRQALNNMSASVSEQTLKIKMLREKLERRTAVLSPTKSFSVDAYQRSFEISSRKPSSLSRYFSSSIPYPRVLKFISPACIYGYGYTLSTCKVLRALVEHAVKEEGKYTIAKIYVRLLMVRLIRNVRRRRWWN